MKTKTFEGGKILIGSFIINFMLAGTARLSAVYFVEALTRYNVNRKQASFPFFLTYIVRNLSGPFVGYLFQIFGMKSMILIGCSISTISIGACFFAEDILAITLLWGLMFGLGYVLGNHMLPALLNELFPESKSKANGFATSGACIGSIFLPLLIENSINLYGVSGSFLILSAVMAHTIPASMLLKNPVAKKSDPYKDKYTKFKLHSVEEQNETHVLNSLEPEKENETHILKSFEPEKQDETQISTSHETEKRPELKVSCKQNEHECGVLVDSNSKDRKKRNRWKSSILSLKVYLDLPFLLLLLINAGTLFICFTVFTIILDFVRDKGVGANLEIYYVVCLPVFDLCGRLGSGVFNDKYYLTTPKTTTICFVCASVSFIAFIFVHHYVLVLLCELFVCVFIGALFVLMIALIPDCIEEDKRTMAMGSRLILYPPFSLGMSPMIGHFRGTQGSYDGVLYVLSGICLGCGFLTYFIPHLTKRRKTRSKNEIFNNPTVDPRM